ncbi:hypothetical protein GCM10011519_34060 [Marmoricola endophyticus]|uniref:Uncharacterized protein n=1 Tax=Marmoricola endophyticus TaxID=2040280 RepID=A0A917BSP9_9ACTN|nr:hypothetical protein [Marmoricola endophyticus]GGF57287.1 hypothetical protein GCM10011519_34060 [Marmoricola endophyticus]
MTWKAYHRRAEVLRQVAAAVDLRRDGTLPTDVPGVAETFTDDLDLIGALHLRWHQRLVGQIEQHQQHHPTDLEASVRDGWLAAARALPGIRLVVDEAMAHPSDERTARALARATLKERSQLALLAGLASPTSAGDERAAVVGARIERDARELWAPGAPMPTAPAAPAAALHRRAVGDVPDRPARPAPAAKSAPANVPAGSPAFARRLRAALSA